MNSFIENFGTHIITSVTIGGKDVIYVKQHQSSPLSKMEIKNYVQDIGSQRFSPTEAHTNSGLLKYKDKASSFNFFYIPCYINLSFKYLPQLHQGCCFETNSPSFPPSLPNGFISISFR